jgi:hypothetical protein
MIVQPNLARMEELAQMVWMRIFAHVQSASTGKPVAQISTTVQPNHATMEGLAMML